MEARAKERLIEEQAVYQEKPAARQPKEQITGKKPRGKAPEPPKEGPRDKDQYNVTDPASRIMKMRGGFEQSFNAQAAAQATTGYAAMKRQSHGRSVAQLEVRDDPPAPPPDAPVAARTAHRLEALGYSRGSGDIGNHLTTWVKSLVGG